MKNAGSQQQSKIKERLTSKVKTLDLDKSSNLNKHGKITVE